MLYTGNVSNMDKWKPDILFHGKVFLSIIIWHETSLYRYVGVVLWHAKDSILFCCPYIILNGISSSVFRAKLMQRGAISTFKYMKSLTHNFWRVINLRQNIYDICALNTNISGIVNQCKLDGQNHHQKSNYVCYIQTAYLLA